MKTINNFLLLKISVLLIVNISVKAQTELTGFFDVISTQNFASKSSHQFQINQFELDVSYAHQTNFSVGTAVALNNESEKMELAMAFVHYSFNDGPALHPRRKETYDHTALLFGKFDIPFGLDYLSFASSDRLTITQPLVIEKTIGGWNDIGIDFHIFHGNFKFDIWAINGFSDGVNLGGNVRYTIFPSIEIGASHSSEIIKLNNSNKWINGIDLQLNSKIFQFQSEYLWTKGIYEGTKDTMIIDDIHHGVYFQLITELIEWTLMPIYLSLRFDAWQSELDRDFDGADDCQNRYTATFGYRIHDNLSFKIEILSSQLENYKREHKAILQAVVSF